ncbi:basic salivary proline-rich protein 1-like [Homarus americanus]|uniref:basic salivary proline-rich protein 1-like n=1 Tax=Homarus americanus TaxID=6706 RepID=UPI001C45E0BF|nr:basic salivary proline-rich protein 1-like [Homarus americanus]
MAPPETLSEAAEFLGETQGALPGLMALHVTVPETPPRSPIACLVVLSVPGAIPGVAIPPSGALQGATATLGSYKERHPRGPPRWGSDPRGPLRGAGDPGSGDGPRGHSRGGDDSSCPPMSSDDPRSLPRTGGDPRGPPRGGGAPETLSEAAEFLGETQGALPGLMALHVTVPETPPKEPYSLLGRVVEPFQGQCSLWPSHLPYHVKHPRGHPRGGHALRGPPRGYSNLRVPTRNDNTPGALPGAMAPPETLSEAAEFLRETQGALPGLMALHGTVPETPPKEPYSLLGALQGQCSPWPSHLPYHVKHPRGHPRGGHTLRGPPRGYSNLRVPTRNDKTPEALPGAMAPPETLSEAAEFLRETQGALPGLMALHGTVPVTPPKMPYSLLGRVVVHIAYI